MPSLRAITASKAGLAISCQVPFSGAYEWDDRESEEARRGTEFHLFAAKHLKNGSRHKLDLVTEEMADGWLESWATYAKKHKVAPVLIEKSFVVDLSKPDLPVERKPYDRAKLQPHEFGCTVDLVVEDERMVRTVIDHKTGQDYDDWTQLLCACYCVWKTDREKQLPEAMEYHFIGEDGKIRVKRKDFVEREVRRAMRAVALAQRDAVKATKPRPGWHCTEAYCPVLKDCPAIRESTAPVVQLGVNGFEIRSPEELELGLQTVKRAKRLTESLTEACKAYALAKGGMLPNGKEYAPSQTSRRSFDYKSLFSDHPEIDPEKYKKKSTHERWIQRKPK